MAEASGLNVLLRQQTEVFFANGLFQAPEDEEDCSVPLTTVAASKIVSGLLNLSTHSDAPAAVRIANLAAALESSDLLELSPDRTRVRRRGATEIPFFRDVPPPLPFAAVPGDVAASSASLLMPHSPELAAFFAPIREPFAFVTFCGPGTNTLLGAVLSALGLRWQFDGNFGAGTLICPLLLAVPGGACKIVFAVSEDLRDGRSELFELLFASSFAISSAIVFGVNDTAADAVVARLYSLASRTHKASSSSVSIGFVPSGVCIATVSRNAPEAIFGNTRFFTFPSFSKKELRSSALLLLDSLKELAPRRALSGEEFLAVAREMLEKRTRAFAVVAKEVACQRAFTALFDEARAIVRASFEEPLSQADYRRQAADCAARVCAKFDALFEQQASHTALKEQFLLLGEETRRNAEQLKALAPTVGPPTRQSSVADVRRWLRSIGFSALEKVFSDNEIDGCTLFDLTEADLKEMGIATEQEQKLFSAILDLCKTRAQPPATPKQTFSESSSSVSRNVSCNVSDRLVVLWKAQEAQGERFSLNALLGRDEDFSRKVLEAIKTRLLLHASKLSGKDIGQLESAFNVVLHQDATASVIHAFNSCGWTVLEEGADIPSQLFSDIRTFKTVPAAVALITNDADDILRTRWCLDRFDVPLIVSGHLDPGSAARVIADLTRASTLIMFVQFRSLLPLGEPRHFLSGVAAPIADVSSAFSNAFLGDTLQDVIVRFKFGFGHFGSVFRGTWYGKDVALKKIGDSLRSEVFQREIAVLRALFHKNVVGYLGIADCKLDGVQTRFIVMELASGCVEDLFKKQRLSTELLNMVILRAIVETAVAMSYLASIPIAHCDLAARNLLFFINGLCFTVKVADVGLALVLTGTGTGAILNHFPLCSAPEVHSQRRFSEQSDVWLFGNLLWELFSHGRQPFPGCVSRQRPAGISDGFYELMLHCCSADPASRPSFVQICRRLQDLCPQLRFLLFQHEAKPLLGAAASRQFFFTVKMPNLEADQAAEISATTTATAASPPPTQQAVMDAYCFQP